MNKIVFFSNDSNLTGAPRSLLELLRGLDKSRFLPLVVTPNDGPLLAELKKEQIEVKVIKSIEKLYGSSEKPVLKVLLCVRRVLVNLWLVIHLYLLIRQARANLIYLNTSAARYASIPSKLSRLPIVWHIREHFEDGLKKKILTKYIRFVSDEIIANSKAVKKMWDRRSIVTRIKVIYNGVDSNLTSLSKAANFPGSVQTDRPVIGYVGQLHQVKGLDVLIEAVESIKDDFPEIRCLIVGAAPKSQAKFETSLRELVRRKKLDGQIEFLGYRDDILRILSNLDVLVLPSTSESFGRVLIEAMVMGRPVVASNVGGIREVVVHGETGLLVPPRNPQVLADSIRFLISNPQKAVQFGKMGRKRAEKMFSLDTYQSQIEALFAALLTRTDRRAVNR